MTRERKTVANVCTCPKNSQMSFLKSLFSSYSERLSKSIIYSVLSFWPLLATLSSFVIAKIHVSDGNIIYTFTCIYFAERINSKTLLHVNAPFCCAGTMQLRIHLAPYFEFRISHMGSIWIYVDNYTCHMHDYLHSIHTDHSEKKPLHVNFFVIVQ